MVIYTLDIDLDQQGDLLGAENPEIHSECVTGQLRLSRHLREASQGVGDAEAPLTAAAALLH